MVWLVQQNKILEPTLKKDNCQIDLLSFLTLQKVFVIANDIF